LRFGEQRFDLVVLHVMMPRMDGLEVCRRLRSRSAVPIIMLTAKAEEIDKVVGLGLLADEDLDPETRQVSCRCPVGRSRRCATLSASPR